jgi:serine/threonine protein kinase/tetratricopeptide (TPR) repeat protein
MPSPKQLAMNSNQWLRVKDLFDESVELSREAREALLKMCPDEETVLDEVRRLLTQYDAAGSFLSAAPASDVPRAFSEGDLIANRYRIVRCIGAGGMGEVYEAIDTELNEQIALKTVRVHTTHLESAYQRLVQEVQLARKISHPNVCRVFHIDRDNQSGQMLFMTMELIHGETLAECVRREKALPPERALAIARQIASGVAAAHALGIVHRDLKPANIILSSDGRTIVTDFGLARRVSEDKTPGITKAGQILGTLPYMAPEQVAGGTATTATDVYALAIIVTEMVTGRRPSDGRDKPSVAQLPKAWGAAIDRAMHADPSVRPQSVGDFIGQLQLPAFRPRAWTSKKPFAIGLTVALALFALVLRLSFWGTGDKPPGGTPVILIGDFDNRTGDSVFELTASSLLNVAMEQSRYLNVLSRQRVSEALSRAGLRPTEPVKSAVALGLAKNEGAHYSIEGEIIRREQANQVALRVVNVTTGRTSKAVQASFAGVGQLPVAIRQVSVELRRWLGEPSAQISATDLPLEQVTTKSALAWERYSRAIQMQAQGRFEDEINLLKSAVEIDSEFALAYDALGFQQNSSGNIPEGLINVTRAYSLRSHATEREAYIIAGHYHTVRYEHPQASEAFRTLTNLYPYDDLGHRFFAQALANQLLLRESIGAGRNAVNLNPKNVINVGTLAGSLVEAGEYDEALALVEKSEAAGVPRLGLAQLRGMAWMGKADFRRAEEAFKEMIADGRQAETGRQQLVRSLILEGRISEAINELETALTRRPANGETRLAFQRRNWLAWLYSLEGHSGLAGVHVQSMLDQPAAPANLRELRGAAVVMYDLGALQLGDRIIERVTEFSRTYGNDYHYAGLAHLNAEAARKRGDVATARRQYAEAIRLWPDALTLWSAARFAEESGETERARTLYADVLSRRGEILLQYFPGIIALAQLGHARTESKLSNNAQSLKDYEAVLATLGRFSPNLDVVKRAALERDRLARALNQ